MYSSYFFTFKFLPMQTFSEFQTGEILILSLKILYNLVLLAQCKLCKCTEEDQDKP